MYGSLSQTQQSIIADPKGKSNMFASRSEKGAGQTSNNGDEEKQINESDMLKELQDQGIWEDWMGDEKEANKGKKKKGGKKKASKDKNITPTSSATNISKKEEAGLKKTKNKKQSILSDDTQSVHSSTATGCVT